MTYPQTFVKVVASGPMLTNGEIWSTSWSMADPDTTNDAEQPPASNVSAIADSVRNWFGRPGSRISSVVKLDRVKVNLVDINGRYVDDSETYEREIDPMVSGGGSGTPWPPQCSIAVSLKSDKRRGPGAFGRFYPPMTVGVIQADGRITAGDAEGLADSASILIRDLNLSAGLTLQVVNASAVGLGTFEKVTSVRVGRVVDTIQRRRNALVEDYATQDVITLPEGP
uniref:Uncharacterized protein n=1 Tax=uncultured prokaryote TaxID=198431 RepID=A0A0H5Q5C1_9ZZZZ|nr:hypothetical protein [uncultured prokaryote]